MNWDAIMRALIFVKIGQELGAGGSLAETIHAWIETIISVACVLR